MNAFVLDNSIMMRWLFKDGSPSDLAYANHVRAMSEELGLSAIAPAIWPMEVTNVIVRAVRRGIISAEQGNELVSIAKSHPVSIETDRNTSAMQPIFHLAAHHQLSAYDASYLELALRRAIPLATLDQDLIKAANAAGVSLL
jgi:predicted nucleic acid-binding protein